MLEVPHLVTGESRRLRMHPEFLIVGDAHIPGRVPPGGGLLRVHAEFVRPLGMPPNRVRRLHQILLRHHIGVDVVVGDRAVLVRPGDSIDVEGTVQIMMAE